MKPDDDISSEPLIRIVCPAIFNKDTGTLYAGVRHRFIRDAHCSRWLHYTEGFLDNQNNFLTRAQAYAVAERAGQIRYPGAGGNPAGELSSEMLF